MGGRRTEGAALMFAARGKRRGQRKPLQRLRQLHRATTPNGDAIVASRSAIRLRPAAAKIARDARGEQPTAEHEMNGATRKTIVMRRAAAGFDRRRQRRCRNLRQAHAEAIARRCRPVRGHGEIGCAPGRATGLAECDRGEDPDGRPRRVRRPGVDRDGSTAAVMIRGPGPPRRPHREHRNKPGLGGRIKIRSETVQVSGSVVINVWTG